MRFSKECTFFNGCNVNFNGCKPNLLPFQMQLMYSEAKELVCITNNLFAFFDFFLQKNHYFRPVVTHVYETVKLMLDVNVSVL